MLSTVGQLFLYNNLTGMEKLFCIPGTLGGAIFMNAGAHGSTIKDIVDRVYYLDENLKVKSLSVKDCKFSYRSSIFKEKNYIILGCKFIKKTKKKEDIKNEMIIWQTYRKFNQNILYPNCGSVFKNGRNFKAWELIDKCNFDNLMVGGAKLSDTHKNFIVNYNNASGRDVITLIGIIKEHVLSKFNIKLEEEIIIFD
jgi:UDP-N-acetylmuramate dehydrogenase